MPLVFKSVLVSTVDYFYSNEDILLAGEQENNPQTNLSKKRHYGSAVSTPEGKVQPSFR